MVVVASSALAKSSSAAMYDSISFLMAKIVSGVVW